MRTNKLFFSIVIPTLNEEKFLPLLLQDLKNQTFKNFEVIHVDGSSEDKTVEISKKFISDFQLEISIIKNRNVSVQRNKGLRSAKGTWVVFMDADNRLRNNYLQLLERKLKTNTCDIFTCYMDNINIPLQDRPLITLSNISLKISSKIKPFAPGALIGIRNHLDKKIEFNESLHLSEDFDFIQQAVKHKLKFCVFDEPKYTYSLRRLKKEGTLKMFRVYAKAQINFFLTGKKINTPLEEYPMNGGSYYTSIPKFSVSKMQYLIENASYTQLTKIKNLIKKLSDL